jgi:hypothetical protein
MRYLAGFLIRSVISGFLSYLTDCTVRDPRVLDGHLYLSLTTGYESKKNNQKIGYT